MRDHPRNNGAEPAGTPKRPDDGLRASSGPPDPRPPSQHERRGPRERGSAPSPDPVGPTSLDAPKPKLVREPSPASDARPFTVDGAAWLAYPAGGGAYGTGHWGLAAVEAIHFARAEAPQEPVLEALVTGGRFPDLFESELIAMFRTARPIVQPVSGAPPPPRRFTLEEDLS